MNSDVLISPTIAATRVMLNYKPRKRILRLELITGMLVDMATNKLP